MNNIKTYEGFFTNIFKKEKVSIDDIIEIFTYILDDNRIRCSLKNGVKFNSDQYTGQLFKSTKRWIDWLSPIYSSKTFGKDFEISHLAYLKKIENSKELYIKPFIYENVTIIRIEYLTNDISYDEISNLIYLVNDRLIKVGTKVSYFLEYQYGFFGHSFIEKNLNHNKLVKVMHDIQDSDVPFYTEKNINIYYIIENITE
jgi:hypothetical protein